MKRRVPTRFSLKWLLILVLFAAVIVWAATQLGMQTAHFEIQKNDLKLDEDGLVFGRLFYRCNTTWSQGWDSDLICCSISHLDQPDLLRLKLGDQFRVRFRSYDVGPLPRQNVYNMFLTDKLNIDAESVKGYAYFDDWTEAVVAGGTE